MNGMACFFLGVLVGVVIGVGGVLFYEIFGRPVMPTPPGEPVFESGLFSNEIFDKAMEETFKHVSLKKVADDVFEVVIKCAEDGEKTVVSVERKVEIATSLALPRNDKNGLIPDPKSLDDMGKTQPAHVSSHGRIFTDGGVIRTDYDYE